MEITRDMLVFTIEKVLQEIKLFNVENEDDYDNYYFIDMVDFAFQEIELDENNLNNYNVYSILKFALSQTDIANKNVLSKLYKSVAIKLDLLDAFTLNEEVDINELFIEMNN